MKKLRLLRNSNGEHDGSWTLAAITVALFQIPMLCGGSEWSQETGFIFRVPTPAETGVAAVITTVVAYVWRKNRREKRDSNE